MSAGQETDSAYEMAVQRGDSKEIERLVALAAKMSGYPLGPLFHGTPEGGFSSFALHPNGNPTGLIFASTERIVAEAFAYPDSTRTGCEEIIPLYGNPGRIADLTAFDANRPTNPSEIFRAIGLPTPPNYGTKPVAPWKLWVCNPQFQRTLAAAGFESFKIKESGGISYGFLDPSQLKSAAPVVRDKAGTLVPLSRRFLPGDSNIYGASDSLPLPYLGEGEFSGISSQALSK